MSFKSYKIILFGMPIVTKIVMKNFKTNPFYLEAIEAYLTANTSKLQSLIDSDKLERIEKDLIQVRILIRDRNWKTAQEKLSRLVSGSSFHLAEIHFLKGNVFGFNANWELSILENIKSYKYYDECKHQRGLFLTTYNLSVDYSNLGLFKISTDYLLQAQKHAESDMYQLQILRGLAWNSLNMGEAQKSLKYLEQGLSLDLQIYQSEWNMFLAVSADIYFRMGKVDESFEMMKTLKFSKSIRDKSRIHFEFKLLEKMKQESQPYKTLDFPSEELCLSTEYSLKWNIIRSLLNGEKKVADSYWSQLSLLFPQYYAANYVCIHAIESQSIFMTFLQQVLRFELNPIETHKKSVSMLSTKQQKLIQILLDSPVGLRKEDLIEKIWNQKYEHTMDAKLYKLIQRIRDQDTFEIITQNQCYHLKKIV